jgi:hypothetical protein
MPITSQATVLVVLRGGLGNQLFQYAAARSIAARNRMELLLDTDTGFRNDPYQRSYRLDQFRIAASSASVDQIARFAPARVRCNLRRLREKALLRANLSFDPLTAHLGRSRLILLNGYFQSEDYFASISGRLREDLRLKSEPTSSAVLKIRDQIFDSNAVCLHVRRLGGYSASRTPVRVVGPPFCTPDYYRRACNHFLEKTSHPRFFVFSDCPEWVPDGLHFVPDKVVVGLDTPTSDIDDLWLMAHCAHFIVADSTFSWWAAWLGSNPAKQVVAPANWGPRHLVPKDWIRL